MLHALVHGQVLFFADCLAHLAATPRAKIFTLLDNGSRAALNAVFTKSGFSPALRNLLARLVFHARAADLADDLAARHFVVSLLIEELIAEHDGDIPPALDEAFAYLNEQNIALARAAARGDARQAAEAPEAEMVPDPAGRRWRVAAPKLGQHACCRSAALLIRPASLATFSQGEGNLRMSMSPPCCERCCDAC